MKCESFIDCLCSCEMKIAGTLFGLWLFISLIIFFVNMFSKDDIQPEEIEKQLVELSLKRIIIKGIVWIAKKIQHKQEEESKKDKKRNKTDDLISIAKTLIETAKNHETITFSGLCEKALEEEWKGRKWLNYIARRLDIIGQCCKVNDFPFINGLTREKYSYKINSGFWSSFWKDLLKIKSYEEQTEENVKEFQQDIYEKIEKMTQEEIDKFLEKLKTFKSTYKD